jgi:hypothetical protein
MLNRQIAYCTNVHAGPDWATAVSNLQQYTVPIRESLVRCGAWQPEEPMGVGLWLAEPAATAAVEAATIESAAVAGGVVSELKAWLASQKLVPFTMNGFPQGNFHQAIVKHRVYQPTWWEEERRIYTDLLITILSQLLPEGVPGSISTLPIAWGFPRPTQDQLQKAANNLCMIADRLDRLFQETGRCIVLAIEPEPGCYLTDNSTMRTFFREHLFQDDSQSEKRRRHLTVCHDICHAAVMREDQSVEFSKHREEGLRIGKVQVSSAIDIDWSSIAADGKQATFDQLKNFAEDRYLHQTTVQTDNKPAILHEDLPNLLASISQPNELSGSWRVHFHVPIFFDSKENKLDSHASSNASSAINHETMSTKPSIDSIGIGTTQKEILRCIDLLESVSAISKNNPDIANDINIEMNTGNKDSTPDFLSDFFTGHYEVETYAWTVLPRMLRQQNSLVDDVCRELTYFKSLFSKDL